MCNEIKCAVQENVQIGCTGDVHIAAVWMMGNNGCDYSLLNGVLWMLCCYETEFRSLMAWGTKLWILCVISQIDGQDVKLLS